MEKDALDVWDTYVNTRKHDIRDVNEYRDHWKKRKSLLVVSLTHMTWKRHEPSQIQGKSPGISASLFHSNHPQNPDKNT